MIGSPPYWESSLPLHKQAQGLVSGVMDHVYGTGPVMTDGTGRPLDSAPVNPFSTSPTPARAVDGGTVTDWAYLVGRAAAARESDAGMQGSVSELQTQFNDFPDASRYTAAKPLKIDRAFGPKTNDRLREVVRTQGSGPVPAAMDQDHEREYLL